jgi:FixJ family two-component response regulator
MMSNLITNSVEAFEGKPGIVKISFASDGNDVNITIQDNGKGMPQEMVEKLMSNESVASTKANGYGIGTEQIRGTLAEFNGSQLIESASNVGTKITLTIPSSCKPTWVIEQITFSKDDTVVILDDDILVHSLWKERLEKYTPDISLKFFEHGQEAVDFINACEAKNRLVLLSDYELRNQESNGLEVIQKSNLKSFQSVIVSSIHNRKEIQDRATELGIRILPKAFIRHVEIVLGEKQDYEPTSTTGANVVIVEDDKYLADLLSDVLRANGLEVDIYYHPRGLIKNLSRYHTATKIITDNSFGSTTGDVLANQLVEQGFNQLCVFTGLVNKEMVAKYPVGTNFILKGSTDSNKYLLDWCKAAENVKPTMYIKLSEPVHSEELMHEKS